MAHMARREDQYLEKVAALQQSLYNREKRRLELERGLFAYSRSDKRISQIKSSKLHSYLRQISDREARAKKRNLELLRDVKCLEISMQECCPDRGPLQQQKDDFLKRISRFVEEKKSAEKDVEAAKVQCAIRPPQDGSLSQLAEDSTQPPILIGRQTSKGSNAETHTTSVHSHQASHRSPNSSMHSCERLPSGLLKDFRVGGEHAASNQAHLSDDISGSNDSPDGCNLSDKHERTLAVLPSAQAFQGVSGNAPFGSDDEQEPPPLVTLTSLERNPSPCSDSSPGRRRDFTAEHGDSAEGAHRTPRREDAGRSQSHLMPESPEGKRCQDKPDEWESATSLSSDVQLPESSASDLSISLTPSESEDDEPGGVAPGRKDTSKRRGDPTTHDSPDSPWLKCENNPPAEASERLSLEGLFYLLESIEQRLCGEQTHVYGGSSLDERRLVRIISLCNGSAGLNGEDLEACGAVVVHELQRLSWSTESGCLLPHDLVSAHQSSTDPSEISTNLPPDAAQLWDRWFKHALLLKERRVLSTELLVELFTPLLLARHAAYSHQAKVLLRTLLSWTCEDSPSAEDHSDSSSSCGASSPLGDGGDMKPGRPVQSQRVQELQSPEEDSQDESPVESVPIRETKAYQLLQSAMQEQLRSCEEEDNDLSGINHGCEVDLGRAKRSSHQDPYPRTEKTNLQVCSAPQPKGPWGESDGDDSDIEAALRPQAFDANDNDADDFYD